MDEWGGSPGGVEHKFFALAHGHLLVDELLRCDDHPGAGAVAGACRDALVSTTAYWSSTAPGPPAASSQRLITIAILARRVAAFSPAADAKSDDGHEPDGTCTHEPTLRLWNGSTLEKQAKRLRTSCWSGGSHGPGAGPF